MLAMVTTRSVPLNSSGCAYTCEQIHALFTPGNERRRGQQLQLLRLPCCNSVCASAIKVRTPIARLAFDGRAPQRAERAARRPGAG